MSDEETLAKYARLEGRARTGTVSLRAFDEGVIRTLRAVEDNAHMVIKSIPGLTLPPGEQGLRVTFFFPEDTQEKFKIPGIVLTRDDISPAMNRWHPGSLQYRVPGVGANPVTARGRQGFDRMEELQQAVPFDITYSMMIYTRTRLQGNILLDYILRCYPPYCNVKVQDSEGDYRLYSAWMESLGMIDDVPEVGNRVIAFAVTLRVEAELDLNDPTTQATVTQSTKPTIRRRGT